MTRQYTLFLKTFNKVAVLVIPTISIVALTVQETLAIPLKPILDQMGNRAIKELVGIDPCTQAVPQVNQLSINREQGTTNSSLPSATYSEPNIQQVTNSPAVSADHASLINTSNYAQAYPGYTPNYPPNNPQGYPGYQPNSPPPPTVYFTPNYPPNNPQGYPGYQPNSPPPPTGYFTPNYLPNNPQGYPGYQPNSPPPPTGYFTPNYPPNNPQGYPGY